MLLIALTAAVAAPQPGQLRTFRDWMAGCDNARTCQAVALLPEQDTSAATMAVYRGPEATARPDMWITARGLEPAAVLVDGRRFALLPSQGVYETVYKPGRAADFLAAIATGKGATLVDRNGKAVAALSLSGASAALLYLDTQQKRIGTVSALIRRGPSRAVPPAPLLPVIVAIAGSPKPPREPAPAAIVAGRGEFACATKADEGETESFRLDAQHSLALVPILCNSGFYNFLSAALIVDEAGGSTSAKFDLPGAVDNGGDHYIYGADWDAKSRRLSTYFKGRGLGDCGVSQNYAWDGERFRLVEQKEMSECRGSTDYITTWRAQVRTK